MKIGAQVIFDDPNFVFMKLETLSALLDQDELNVTSETDIYRAVAKWADSECARRMLKSNGINQRKVLGEDVLSKVRFLAFTHEQFAEVAGDSDLLTAEEKLMVYNCLLRPEKYVPKGVVSNNRKARTCREKLVDWSSKLNENPPSSFQGCKFGSTIQSSNSFGNPNASSSNHFNFGTPNYGSYNNASFASAAPNFGTSFGFGTSGHSFTTSSTGTTGSTNFHSTAENNRRNITLRFEVSKNLILHGLLYNPLKYTNHFGNQGISLGGPTNKHELEIIHIIVELKAKSKDSVEDISIMEPCSLSLEYNKNTTCTTSLFGTVSGNRTIGTLNHYAEKLNFPVPVFLLSGVNYLLEISEESKLKRYFLQSQPCEEIFTMFNAEVGAVSGFILSEFN